MILPKQLSAADNSGPSDAFSSETDPSFLAKVTDRDFPRAWYFFASTSELSRGPLTIEILGKKLVGFLTQSGKPGVLASRCVHMGSDLGQGCVAGESLRCSLHHWRYRTDGQCTEIPASKSIPKFAKQKSFPAVIRQGNVYFFFGETPDYELPFFNSVIPDDLVAARPFVQYIDCPWYMVGSNAVDMQHFSIAHDRQLLKMPVVDHPDPLAHRVDCHFSVAGNSLADKLTQHFGGAEVNLNVTDWCSTMILAHSRLRRTETFGLVCVVPLSPVQTKVHVTVMARASEGRIKRFVLDHFRATVRRYLIGEFLRSDIHRLVGTQFSPTSLLEIDEPFRQYFQWLAGVIRRPMNHNS